MPLDRRLIWQTIFSVTCGRFFIISFGKYRLKMFFCELQDRVNWSIHRNVRMRQQTMFESVTQSNTKHMLARRQSSACCRFFVCACGRDSWFLLNGNRLNERTYVAVRTAGVKWSYVHTAHTQTKRRRRRSSEMREKKESAMCRYWEFFYMWEKATTQRWTEDMEMFVSPVYDSSKTHSLVSNKQSVSSRFAISE